MARYVLSVPKPEVAFGFTCWAAALAAWLDVTKRLPGASSISMQTMFFNLLDDEGSLPESMFRSVFGTFGMQIEGPIKSSGSRLSPTLTYSKFLQILKTKGHILMMEKVAGEMAHANVVYGVGVPSDDHFSVLDVGNPSTYRNRRLSSISYPCYLAYRK
jgi:hypothetical protein